MIGGRIGQSVSRLAQRLGRGTPPVGMTPYDVVWTENKWRLLRFRRVGQAPARYQTPVLMVPSLINRWYILDLQPGRSLVEWLTERGHDVYLIDWGSPGPEDRYLTFDDICDRYIGRAVRQVARRSALGRVHVLGYCLGGTLASIFTAAHPDRVASLVALAAPIDFHDDGLLSVWTRIPSFDVASLIAAFGNVPWPLMQASFHMLKPTLGLGKVVSLLDRAWDDEFLDGFWATEKWGNDNVSFPGACYQRYIEELYRQNALVRGSFSLSGAPVHLSSIDCPTMAVTFQHDHIVPAASGAALLEKISSADRHHVHLSGGHIGAVVSRKAADRLWPQLAEFWAARDRPATLHQTTSTMVS